MPNNQIERDTIFYTKALGIILVVIGHYQISASDPVYWSLLRKMVYVFHMPLFMGVSGYLFGKKYDVYTQNGYLAFVSGKAKRLIWPYLAISLILLIIKFGAGFIVDLKYPIGSDFLKYIIFNPMGGFSTYLWFIYTLFVIFLVFPLLRWIVRNNIVLLLGTVVLSFLPAPQIFCLDLVLQYLPFFTIGFVAANHLRGITRNAQYLGWLLLPVFLVALWLRFGGIEVGVQADNLLGIVLAISGSLLSVLVALFIAMQKKMVPASIRMPLTKVGESSSVIYLFHTMSMAPVYFLTHRAGLSSEISAMLTSSAGLLIPIVLKKYILDPSPLLKKYIMGAG